MNRTYFTLQADSLEQRPIRCQRARAGAPGGVSWLRHSIGVYSFPLQRVYAAEPQQELPRPGNVLSLPMDTSRGLSHAFVENSGHKTQFPLSVVVELNGQEHHWHSGYHEQWFLVLDDHDASGRRVLQTNSFKAWRR